MSLSLRLDCLSESTRRSCEHLVLEHLSFIAHACFLRQSFESFSEDPHLSGTICTAYIKGVQNGGIGATIKHFV